MTDESNRKQRFCKILLEEAQTRKSLNENFSTEFVIVFMKV